MALTFDTETALLSLLLLLATILRQGPTIVVAVAAIVALVTTLSPDVCLCRPGISCGVILLFSQRRSTYLLRSQSSLSNVAFLFQCIAVA